MGTIINAPVTLGRRGKSAYEVAVENGFEGTEAEWLESLEGSDASVNNTNVNNAIEDNASASRTALGLGNAATRDVPSSGNATSAQVVKGDDTRLTDARTPTAHTHTPASIGAATAAQGAKADTAVQPNDTSNGGNGAADSGKLPKYDAGGKLLTHGVVARGGNPTIGETTLAQGVIDHLSVSYDHRVLDLHSSGDTAATWTMPVDSGVVVVEGGALGTPSSGNASNLTSLNASALTSGTVPPARLSMTKAELDAAVSDGDVVFTSSKASKSEAEAGTDNDKWMTPLRTAQAIAAQAPGGIDAPAVTSLIQSTPVWPPYDSIPASAGGTGLRPLPEYAAWFEMAFDASGGSFVMPVGDGGEGTLMDATGRLYTPNALYPYPHNSIPPIGQVMRSPNYEGSIWFWQPSYGTLKLESTQSGYLTGRSGNLYAVTLGSNGPFDHAEWSIVPLLNCQLFFCRGEITEFDLTHATAAGCPTYIEVPDCYLAESSIDALLAHLVATGKMYGNIYANGSNAAPSAAGLASKATLVSRGWIVDTN